MTATANGDGMAGILIYGDSNSHGTVPLSRLGQFARYPPGQPWPDVMARALGPGHRVICEALPGRTTLHDDLIEGGNRNGLSVLPAVLLSHAPLDLVILMLGTNDLKPRFSVTAFEIARSLERLIAETRALLPGVALLLVCPAPLREAGPLADAFAGAEARQAGMEAQFAAAAERAGVPLVLAGETVTVSAVDGVHWEAGAHAAFGAVMAERVAALLAARGLAADTAIAKAALPLPAPDPDAPAAPVTLRRPVPAHWADYNGHMNEGHYLRVFSDATDQLLDWAGLDAACVAAGHSVFTIETHLRHLAEVAIGDEIAVTTRVLTGAGRKLHVWHELSVGDRLCATAEQMLLHVALATRRAAAPRADVGDWLMRAQAAHAALPPPDGLARHVGQRP